MMFTSVFTTNGRTATRVAVLSLLVLLAGNLCATYGWYSINIDTHDTLIFEKSGLFFNTIAFTATLLYVLLSGSDIEKVGVRAAEYYALIFFSLCGVSILSSYHSLLMLFLGVEIMSIPLYILTGSEKKNLKSNEAALKYFLMGAFSTGILLMGIALQYGVAGNFSLDIPPHPQSLAGVAVNYGILSPLGLVLIFIALAFKVSAAPFHFWTPDVYDGAPSVFTSFMATIVKAAGFIALIRLFNDRAIELQISWRVIVPLMIVATLLVGNITAVFQQSVKRMLAYSSIAQAGFMLFAVYSGSNDLSREGILLYAAAYSLATIGIFGILIKMKDYTFDGYNGLARRHPVLAFTNTIFLLSLAGIPLTAGFFAKYYMLASVVRQMGHSALWLVVVAVLFAAVSAVYYFRVIQAMYFREGDAEVAETSTGFKIVLLVLAAIIILLGVMPSLLLNWLYF